MAENLAERTERSLDIEQIKSLAELMAEHDLNRLEWSDGREHIVLRRGQPVVAPAPMMAPAAVVAATASAAAEPVTDELFIRSPMVGTFYLASDPESPPFVTIGDAVSPDRVVCIIEAMKVFNEINAEVSGRILRVLVKNAEAVEFDQPLFAIVPV